VGSVAGRDLIPASKG